MAYMPEIERITVDELQKRLDDGEELVLIDVRNPTDYGESHAKIPGSLHFEMKVLEEGGGDLDTSKDAVTYCT